MTTNQVSTHAGMVRLLLTAALLALGLASSNWGQVQAQSGQHNRRKAFYRSNRAAGNQLHQVNQNERQGEHQTCSAYIIVLLVSEFASWMCVCPVPGAVSTLALHHEASGHLHSYLVMCGNVQKSLTMVIAQLGSAYPPKASAEL